MSSHFAVLTTLALALLFTPETLVLGLVLASDRNAPRQVAFAFAVGGVLGIAFATGIGLWIAHASGADAATPDHHAGWPGFAVRIAIAAALLTIGLYRAVNAVRRKPIPDVSAPEHRPSRLRTSLTRHFPNLKTLFDQDDDVPVRRRVIRAGLAGFGICGLHPKVFPIAIAAGHQIVEIPDHPERMLGILVFAAISVVPAVAPAVIELVSPGASGRIKDGYERVMKVHGRWIGAVLLVGAGAFVGHSAFAHLPGR